MTARGNEWPTEDASFAAWTRRPYAAPWVDDYDDQEGRVDPTSVALVNDTNRKLMPDYRKYEADEP